jgi:hypothetical protein
MCPGRQSLVLKAVRNSGPLLAIALLSASAFASTGNPTGYDLKGRAVDPFKASQGKLVVLLFVRTDCPISNRYAPAIQRMSAAHAGTARFWLIYPDKNEPAEKIQAHDREYRYEIPALRDPNHELVKLSEVTITPEAAVFTSEGRLVYHGRIDNWFVDMGRARSAPTKHDLEAAIEAAEKNPNASLASQPAVGCYISDLD